LRQCSGMSPELWRWRHGVHGSLGGSQRLRASASGSASTRGRTSPSPTACTTRARSPRKRWCSSASLTSPRASTRSWCRTRPEASRQGADRRAVREGEHSPRSPGAPRARTEAALAWRALRWHSSAGGHDRLDLRSPTGISPKAARYVFYDYGKVAISEFNARDLRGGPGSFSSWSHDAGDARHAHKSELQTFDRRRAQPGRRVRQRVRVSVRELRAGSRRRSARRPCAATGAAALAVPPCMRREAGVPLAQPSVRVTEAECHPTPPRGSFVAVVGGGGCILRASVRPVDLNRYALRVGSRVDQVKRDVRAGVGE
jgi:hypothetical protein